MKTDNFFDKVTSAREDAIAHLDVEFSHKIRNHLVQLFCKAYNVAPNLEGVLAAMGTAFVKGSYVAVRDEDGSLFDADVKDYGYMGGYVAKARIVDEFLEAVKDYGTRVPQDLPYIDDITRDDLVSRRVEKAKIRLGYS